MSPKSWCPLKVCQINGLQLLQLLTFATEGKLLSLSKPQVHRPFLKLMSEVYLFLKIYLQPTIQICYCCQAPGPGPCLGQGPGQVSSLKQTQN